MDVITFLENLKTTSGLLILLHCVIPLPGATSYDKTIYIIHVLYYDNRLFRCIDLVIVLSWFLRRQHHVM